LPKAVLGVYQVNYGEYKENLCVIIDKFDQLIHKSKYKILPSLRAYIFKADRKMRLSGIAAIEVKIVQCAVVEILSAIYEVDLLVRSYEFMPEGNYHDPLDRFYMDITTSRVSWIVDAE
jgi:retron-type reverse transcriptase